MSLEFHTIPELLEDADYQGFWPRAASPNKRYLLTKKYQALWTLDRTNESYTTAFMPDESDDYSGVAIDNDGTIYATQNSDVVAGFDKLVKILTFGNGAKTTLSDGLLNVAADTLGLFIMPSASKKLVWGEDVDALDIKVYTIGTGLATVANSSGQVVIQTVQDSYGDVWAISCTTTTIRFQRVVSGGAGTAAPNYQSITLATSDQNGAFEVYHSSAGWFVVWNAGADLYLLSDVNFSILVHRSYAANGVNLVNFPLFSQPPFLLGLAPGASSFWLPGPVTYGSSLYGDLHKITAATLATSDTHDVADWAIGDQPDNGGGLIYTTHTREALASQSYQGPDTTDYTTVLRYFTDDGGGGGGGGGSSGDHLDRVWGFSLDDHDFYVLPSVGLIYDLKTNQWSEWVNEGLGRLRACVGQNWVGMTESLATYGADIVAGDDTEGVLWVFDPNVARDDLVTTGDESFTRIATSMVAVNGRETIPCNAVELTCSLGEPSQTGAAITLRTSDDLGKTWVNHGSQVIAAGEFDAVIEWRGLGVIRAPGRIFRFSDDGATVRYGRAEMR